MRLIPLFQSQLLIVSDAYKRREHRYKIDRLSDENIKRADELLARYLKDSRVSKVYDLALFLFSYAFITIRSIFLFMFQAMTEVVREPSS